MLNNKKVICKILFFSWLKFPENIPNHDFYVPLHADIWNVFKMETKTKILRRRHRTTILMNLRKDKDLNNELLCVGNSRSTGTSEGCIDSKTLCLNFY